MLGPSCGMLLCTPDVWSNCHSPVTLSKLSLLELKRSSRTGSLPACNSSATKVSLSSVGAIGIAFGYMSNCEISAVGAGPETLTSCHSPVASDVRTIRHTSTGGLPAAVDVRAHIKLSSDSLRTACMIPIGPQGMALLPVMVSFCHEPKHFERKRALHTSQRVTPATFVPPMTIIDPSARPTATEPVLASGTLMLPPVFTWHHLPAPPSIIEKCHKSFLSWPPKSAMVPSAKATAT
mmetsp:Transcript_28798/g.66991  ORF Transcript_28798/g.66991 Transcript_28798/m.66991 type:complete len:236 (+) Transcript_28798:527-1234(+)